MSKSVRIWYLIIKYLLNAKNITGSINLVLKGVYFINTARANIFERQALLEGLNSGHMAGYAADVPMAPYPNFDDELINHPKTLITPHVSSLTDSTYFKMCQETIENVYKLLSEIKINSQNIANYREIN